MSLSERIMNQVVLRRMQCLYCGRSDCMHAVRPEWRAPSREAAPALQALKPGTETTYVSRWCGCTTYDGKPAIHWTECKEVSA